MPEIIENESSPNFSVPISQMEFERKDQLQLSGLLMSVELSETPARLILQGTSFLSCFTSELPALIYGEIKLGHALGQGAQDRRVQRQ